MATLPTPDHVRSFHPNDDDLRLARVTRAEACAEYNTLREDASSHARGNAFVKVIPVSARNPDPISGVRPPFQVDYGLRVQIGGTTFIDRGCKIVDTPVADIRIGEYCHIGPNVTIASAGPPTAPINIEALSRGRFEMTGKPVTICGGVWVGASATIGPGVTVGEGAKIAVGAVVLDDVPPYTEVRGNPAKA